MPASVFPIDRLRLLNKKPLNSDASYVLYWMVANRRLAYNYSLDRAVEYAMRLNKPLLVVEPLAKSYRWSSPRLHHFVMEGMEQNLSASGKMPLTYYPFVESDQYPQSDMLRSFSADACVVVTDDFPCFFIPKLLKSLGRTVPCQAEAIDSNGVLPMRAESRLFTTAYSFRRHCQKVLPMWLQQSPSPNPTQDTKLPHLQDLDENLTSKWPSAELLLVGEKGNWMQSVSTNLQTPVTKLTGGRRAALECWRLFKNRGLSGYDVLRNQVDQKATSCLSPYLHFGHISTHEIVKEIFDHQEQTPDYLNLSKVDGRREGWWKMSAAVEAFLDQLIIWREIGFNRCANDPNFKSFNTLPQWSLITLNEHRNDFRPYLYSLEDFEDSLTHDSLWNAAQNQLKMEGVIHNYLRMLWGKKILHWSESPEQALDIMIELNNKYALDGRNPNSYSGIFWCLGRFDRAWGPERPIFGKVRYMTSENTARKYNVKSYIANYTDKEQGNTNA
ncbi:MAG: deoxyribodipyrimidine photolyase [Planctomycetaceae bacterium]|nr:deoxyribodipyrimidine photolyase [Planctomycetaceae bacterium]